ncbi:hypothetical protein DFJ58DRAFT_917399 [Suillus subalutaceus]|uniref:uncharacterized protein n=1 Tax=Suillus subalutaceus TaxID=48586 RepID=UPI001B85EBE5|nr:uncharacterized protein DFJ58DRAFT_917399 [Suillus subalutaceus]KAG1837316.1 hypothetical protein DFJ58DRAFT_917399 [Suillus subalutaceus]
MFWSQKLTEVTQPDWLLTQAAPMRSASAPRNAAAALHTSLITWNQSHQGPLLRSALVANAINELPTSVPSHAHDDLERRLLGKLDLHMLVIVVIYILNYACGGNLGQGKNLKQHPVTDQSWTICRWLFYIEGSIAIFIAICERALGISHPAEDGYGRVELEKKTIMQVLVLWDAVSDGKVSIYTMSTARDIQFPDGSSLIRWLHDALGVNQQHIRRRKMGSDRDMIRTERRKVLWLPNVGKNKVRALPQGQDLQHRLDELGRRALVEDSGGHTRAWALNARLQSMEKDGSNESDRKVEFGAVEGNRSYVASRRRCCSRWRAPESCFVRGQEILIAAGTVPLTRVKSFGEPNGVIYTPGEDNRLMELDQKTDRQWWQGIRQKIAKRSGDRLCAEKQINTSYLSHLVVTGMVTQLPLLSYVQVAQFLEHLAIRIQKRFD